MTAAFLTSLVRKLDGENQIKQVLQHPNGAKHMKLRYLCSQCFPYATKTVDIIAGECWTVTGYRTGK